ncbi:MAG: hypothetical protein ABWK01_06390 [Infirmifilum sp.]
MQILNTELKEGFMIVDVRNLSPGDLEIKDLSDSQVYGDNKRAVVEPITEAQRIWKAGTVIKVITRLDISPYKRHIVVLYDPCNP